jgi:hypothetical protein
MDWLAAGLPVEGTRAHRPRIVDHAHRDVPACGHAEPAETVRIRVRAAGWDAAVVVDGSGIVLGLFLAAAKPHEGGPTVADVMMPAPVTVRPHLLPGELPEAASKQERFLVTTSDGVLMGLVRRADLRAARRRPTGERAA